MHWPAIVDDLADLVLGRRCLDCETPGRALCAGCLATLQGRCMSVPLPISLPPTVAATGYDGITRRAVLAYKEHGNRGLAPPLGALLADAVRVHGCGSDGYVLIPVPSHRHAERGFDALAALAQVAAGLLRRDQVAVRIERPITVGRAYSPLKGLGRQERFRRIHGAFVGSAALGRRIPRQATIIVVDDVVTSGATLGEAVRALGDVDVRVDGIAAIAAATRGRPATNREPARPMPRC